MPKRMVIMLAAVGLVLGLVFGFKAFVAGKISESLAGLKNVPQTVSTTTADYQEWQSRLDAVGGLRAVKGADLSLEVAGIVDEIDFNSGDDVVAGAPLLRLRADDDIAKLRSLEATAQLAQITYQRDEKQFKAQAVSQATLDTDAANLKNANAQVAEQQAMVNKKIVRAPFAGHLGIRAVDLGQYLSPGTPIVTLQALDPIYVDFYLPQQSIDQVKVGQKVTTRIDAYPDQTFPGEITAISPKVDPNTRNAQLRATLDNADRKLLPGMYARVDITTGTSQRYLTLPQTAVAYNPYGSTVYIVEDKGKDAQGRPQLAARQTLVTTGPTRGDQVAVLSGVKEGDEVVTAGQIKLHNGSPLAKNNDIQPTADANPLPTEQ
jgi:membrane fusion protein (multidrug efflux system)